MVYDLIIVGGGMVGRSLACALRKTPLKIALVDAAPEDRPDPRLIALNYGSQAFFERLGIWPQVAKEAAPIQEVQVSHRGHFGCTRLLAKDLPLPALGYVVPAQALNQALGKVLSEEAEHYSELRPLRVKGIEMKADRGLLQVEKGEESVELQAEVILAADGTHSTIRDLLQFETKTVDYQQSALVTTCLLSRSPEGRAYERFLDEGALALLPLTPTAEGQHRAACIWTTGTPKVEALMQEDEATYLATLQTAFGYRLGSLKGITQRHVFPLHFIQAKDPLKGNLLLLGNAAHTIHPLAAQGLNLALFEIATLSQHILERVENQQSLTPLNFQAPLEGKQKTNLLLSHYLTPLFASNLWGLSLARQLGMIGLDLCKPLKTRFSRILAMESLKWT